MVGPNTIWQMADSLSSALYVLYFARARSLNQWQLASYPNLNTKISNETRQELEELSFLVYTCLLWNNHRLLNFFLQVSVVFKSWITRVYLIQTAIDVLHPKKKKNKRIENYCVRKTTLSFISCFFHTCFHVFSIRIFVESGYFDIPELNIKTSLFNAVFTQIIMKR